MNNTTLCYNKDGRGGNKKEIYRKDPSKDIVRKKKGEREKNKK
jgi:hypothetical protein